jgi:acetylornithine deacetylase
VRIDGADLRATLAALVRIDSVNPAFSGGSTDERAIAEWVGDRLRELGLQVHFHEPEPGRSSVVGRLVGTGGGPSLLLYSHLDTVGVDGMPEPFAPVVREGRMYGRGAYDMKGGLAACLAAARSIVESGTRLRGDLLVVGVADEEAASIGMSEVLRHHTAAAAIVTEPTGLDVCLVHKGFCWVEVETHGRAAHGSRFEEGVDANLHMGRFLSRLDGLERELRARAPHPRVGPPSLHAATLQGGTGLSTYAAHCRLQIERRTVPGETPEQVLAEIQGILDALAAEDAAFQASARLLLARDAWEAPADARITTLVLDAAAQVLGRVPDTTGMSFWMDAALLGAAGIPTVVIGPAGAGAHAVEEWVDLASVERTAEILARAAMAFCGNAADAEAAP